MKTGISTASYFYTRGLREPRAHTPEVLELMVLPLRYFRPYPRDFFQWFIQRAARLHEKYGLHGIRADIPPEEITNEEYIRNMGKLVRENGLYFTHLPGALLHYEHPDYVKEKIMPQVVKYMDATDMLGVTCFTVAGPNTTWNRFRRGPSMEWRLERVSQNFKQVAEAGSSYRFTIALENHADYRVDEVLDIIRRAKADDVMINFDTGNTFLTIEDPVEAAKLAAPRTVCTHLKDWKVLPSFYGGRFVGVPIGSGDVDHEAVFEILQDKAPDPSSISLNVENLILEGDEDQALEESIRYLTQDLKRFID